jgi:hypothetical protein
MCTRRNHFSRTRMRIIFLSSVVFTASALVARDKTDVMVMKNGDRMTCEVKRLDAGVLYVSFDYIDGTASVDWSKVARLESKQLFVVKTQDGSVYTGTLNTLETPPGRPVSIQVVETPQPSTEVEKPQIVEMVATSDRFWRRFNGELSLGTIYSKGNNSTQYSLDSQTTYVQERWTAGVGFDSSLSSSTGANTSTRNLVNVSALHLLPRNHWFYSGLVNFLQSSEQGIALQSTLGGGVGQYLYDTNRASIAVLGGAAWQHTSYEQSHASLESQNLAAAMIYSEVQFFRFSKTNFEASAAFLPAVTDLGRLRFDTKATYYVKLIRDLKWNISFYGNWDNRPPSGFSGSDYGTSSGLSWTFGLK